MNSLYEKTENRQDTDDCASKLLEMQKQLAEAEAQLAQLSREISEYKNSRGYRFLQKYYRMRDWLLPRDSFRYLAIKLSIQMLRHMPLIWRMLTVANVKKTLHYIRHGNIKSTLLKIERKFRSQVVQPDAIAENSQFMLSILQDKQTPAVIPAELVVDIIIPVYNAYLYTKKCLQTVYDNTDVPYNLYIINDCSPDERIRELLAEIESQARPALLQELHIIHNEQNLGFVRTVNAAMALAQNHVVILNTDTEVPPGWLSRLLQPLLIETGIASVTPFSNSATICSFPGFCQDNDLPYDLNVNQVDSFFAAYAPVKPVTVPTGVGFCMLLNQQVLREIGFFDAETYDKGYAEENDWCMRAAQQGYHHVMQPNLFVYHKHGVSFASHNDKDKEQRIQENLAKLASRYPQYDTLVQEFIGRDPLKELRLILWSAITADTSTAPGILFITNSLGGGTKHYLDTYIDKIRTAHRIYKLEYCTGGQLLLIDDNQGQPLTYSISQNELTNDSFNRLLALWKIDRIFVNQLVEHQVYHMLNMVTRSGKPYHYFIHDYYCICPSYNLVDINNRYCHGETGKTQCTECLRQGLSTEPWINMTAEEIDIQAWREAFHCFLAGASKVLAPSQTTQQIVNRYYPDISIEVREHTLTQPLVYTYDMSWLEQPVLTIACIGAIGVTKGLDELYSLVEIIRQEQLPFRITVIGVTSKHGMAYTSPDGIFHVTGPYDNKDISQLLAKQQSVLVLIPSIWPETFSYTTSEAMLSGYPVLTFDIGAPAERVRRLDAGWLATELTAGSLAGILRQLAQARGEIAAKARKLIPEKKLKTEEQ